MTQREPSNTIKSILFESPLSITRFWLCMGSLTWAFLLALPGDLFIPSRTTYTLMARIAPEMAWAMAFFVHGVWAFYTLRTGTRNHVSLTMDAFLGCVLWTSSTALCFAAHWPGGDQPFFDKLLIYPMPAAMSGEFWMSVAAWWHLVRYWAEESHS